MIKFSEEEKRFMKMHDIDEIKLLQGDNEEIDKLNYWIVDLIDEPEGEIPDEIMNKLYIRSLEQ